MVKTYTEQLSEWVKKASPHKRDKGLVAFLAAKEDVTAAIDAGYSAKTIWRHMRELKRVNVGYDTFIRYVKRFIHKTALKKQTADTTHHETNDRKENLGENEKQKEIIKKKQTAQSGFTFDPTPNKEDLL